VREEREEVALGAEIEVKPATVDSELKWDWPNQTYT
jgi:hypothetical protein